MVKVGEEPCHDYATARLAPYRLECGCATEACRRVVTEANWQFAEVQRCYSGFFMPHMQRRVGSH